MTLHTITPANVRHESYFNLCRLADLTGYSDPIAATIATGAEWRVKKDECGNLISLAS